MKQLLLIDTVIQGGLIALITAGFLPALFFRYDDLVILSLLGGLALGGWQILANIWWMLAGKGQGRPPYLVGVLAFFFFAAMLAKFSPHFTPELIAGKIFWIGIPYALAIWSFWLSAVQLSAAYSRPRKFWDI